MLSKLTFGSFHTEDSKNFRRLIQGIRAYRGRIALALFATIGVAFAEGYLAAFIAPLINQGFSNELMSAPVRGEGLLATLSYWRQSFTYLIWGASSKVWLVPTFLVGLMVFRGICRYISSYHLAWVGSTLLTGLRTRIFTKMLTLPADYHQTVSSGIVLGRTFGNAQGAITGAINIFITLTRDSLIVLFLVLTLVYLNWMLSLTILVVFPLMLMVSKFYRARLRTFNIETQTQNATLSHTIQETYDGYKVVKLFNGAHNALTRFNRQNHALLHYSKKLAQAESARSPITELISSFGLAFVIFVALWQSQQGMTTVGEFMAFIVAMLQMISPLKNLSSLSVPMQAMFISSDVVCEFLDAPQEHNTGTQTLKNQASSIEFKNLTLRYPEQTENAVNQFNLHIAQGEKIALVGRSGSGKTSIINMLPRFIAPTSGQICINGIDIAQLDLTELRAQFAIVSQDVFLFSDTLYENVKYGNPNAKPEDIESALRAANLWEWVQSQPEGLKTLVGTNGNQLSGGQRQRLSIARAILKNAPILILDEATSALDNESEQWVQSALDHLMVGRTSIMIAHRLSTIQHADKIIVLDKGKIVEVGQHEELLKQSGIYAHLHSMTQFDGAPSSRPSNSTHISH